MRFRAAGAKQKLPASRQGAKNAVSIGSLPHLFNNPFGDFLSLFVRLAGEPENAVFRLHPEELPGGGVEAEMHGAVVYMTKEPCQ